MLHEECMAMRETPGTSQSSQKKPKQSLIADAFSSVTPYESTSTRHKDITEAITYHIAKDMVPVYTVSKDGFKKMVQTLDKRYKIPSRTHFNQVAIPKLYNECKMNVESKLREINWFFIYVQSVIYQLLYNLFTLFFVFTVLSNNVIF